MERGNEFSYLTARFTDTEDLGTWSNAANRGFRTDGTGVEADIKMTGLAKASLLNIVLGSIASYSPVISWAFITQEATSLEEIWNRLRAFYGFRRTGTKITELMDIKLEPGESREALWERLYSFMESNLLSTSGSVKHLDKDVTQNEILTPTLLNTMVVMWLNIIHSNLPATVCQYFSTHLRESTIFTIRNEISDAIPTLLKEINEKEGMVNRSGSYNNNRSGSYNNQKFQNRSNSSSSSSFKKYRRKCSFCEVAGRSAEGHYLSACPFLPPEDKKYMSRVRDIAVNEDDDNYYDDYKSPADAHTGRTVPADESTPGIARRVDIISSPVLNVLVNSIPSDFTVDCGAETNLVEEAECHRIGAKIHPTSQRANMADGTSPLQTVGETHFTAIRDHHEFEFSGLVVKRLDCPVLAGMPFLQRNDVYVRFSANMIHLGDCCTVKYGAKNRGGINRRIAIILRVPRRTCLLPGEKISLPLPEELKTADEVALEPRCMSVKDITSNWLKCSITNPDQGSIDVVNSSEDPVVIEKHDQFCQVRPVVESSVGIDADYPLSNLNKPSTTTIELHSSAIQVDPSNTLPPDVTAQFYSLHKEYDEVFSDTLGCYNGHSGEFCHIINMGASLPPQRKGRIPMYNRGNLEVLQLKFDELHRDGVFARPEDIGVSVEYVNPSFLLKKASGGHRLVTSFGQVAEFAKPQPTVTSNVEDVLQQVGQWKYIIKSDLKSAYYQIPIHKNSMKYVGVATPFRGTLVYCRSVMGLPGSEAALEEILNRVLGDLIQEGKVAKLADDLYVGSNSTEGLLDTWRQVLMKLHLNGFKLSPAKTICNPISTTILGWLWEQGTIRATPHRLNALTLCTPPETVKALRSFIGCYKFMSRVLPFYADMLHPLDEACSSSKSADKIQWTDKLTACFEKAKEHLREAQTVVLPRYDDQLHIITDAAVRCSGIASALYVVRSGKPRLAGYFNAKRKSHQAGWLPCEVEALSIGCGIKHFAPYIAQSKHVTRILTDSKPCVLAYKKLCRGEFSVSPRVTTFLSIATRFKVEVMHISGKDNIFSDFMSRNPITCKGECQVCDFVHRVEASVVGGVTVSDILSGTTHIPFTSRTAWYQIQQNCPDLSRVSKYLHDGISPSKKQKGITNVRRYLNSNIKLSTTPNDKLLIIPASEPFKQTKQRIVIPTSVSDGLLMALHIQLQHPSKHQLKKVFCRAFFALDLDKLVDKTVDCCHTCAALQKVPARFHQQTTSKPPEIIGAKYSSDVMRRCNQCILILRESISSYTDAVVIEDEKADTLREGLIQLASRFRSPMSPTAVIRTDPSTSLQSLVNDKLLLSHKLVLELGEAKNINKNPIAEKCIEELHAELVRVQPLGGKISDATLASAVSTLNSRIRFHHLSATEIWTQRDMMTGGQLKMSDKQLISDKVEQRIGNHQASAKYRARGDTTTSNPVLKTGDIIYIYSDRKKTGSREKYLVLKVEELEIIVQKFAGNQLRAKQYRVKKSDVITVSTEPIQLKLHESDDSESESENIPPVPDVNDVIEHENLQADLDENLPQLPEADGNQQNMNVNLQPPVADQRHKEKHVRIDGRPKRKTKPPVALDDYKVDFEADSD